MGYIVQIECGCVFGYINFLISNSFKMRTLNEHSLPHNLYNNQIHFSESDKELKETGNNDFLSDIDIHSIQNNQCSYYNITEFNTDITIKNIYYRFIVRFPIGLDFPFITLPFQGC